MADAVLIEQLRAKVEALRSPRGVGRGARDAADSSAASTTSKDSGSRLNSARGRAPLWEPGHEADSAIVVNVGGVSYTTTVATLKAVESSYFSLMLNGLWEPARTRGGDIFVDRNGELFCYVLEHLRAECHKEPDTFQLPDDLDTLNGLLREAEFYRLPALVSRLKKRKEEMIVAENRNGAVPSIHAGYRSMDPVPHVELDIAYSTISSAHSQFTEEALHNLSMQINGQILRKGHNGFKVKDVSSRVHFNPNDPKLPYSMTCTAVLVRERGALQWTGCAAPADHCDKCHSSSLVPEPVDGSLQRGTDSRLRLQLLVAQHASNVNQQRPIVSSQGLGPAHNLSLNDIFDQSMNPPAGALGVSALHSPVALHSQERSPLLQEPIQNGSPGGMEWDPCFGGYTGEVRRIMGIPQAPGCQSNLPAPTVAMEDCSTVEMAHEGSKRSHRGEVGHVLESPVARGGGVPVSRGHLDVLVPGRSNRQARLGSHPCCVDVGVAAQGLDSSSDVSMASVDHEVAADTLVTDQPAIPKEETVDGIEICWSESSDSGSLTSESSVCEPPVKSVTERPGGDGQQEDVGHVTLPGASAGVLSPLASEIVSGKQPIAHQNAVKDVNTEADSGLAGKGQHTSACCIDAAHSSGFGDTSLVRHVDAGEGSSQHTPGSLINGTEATADVLLKHTLQKGSKVEVNRGHGLDDAEWATQKDMPKSEQQDIPRSAREPAVYQIPTPDRETQRQHVQQRYVDDFGNVLSPRDSRALTGRDLFPPCGVRVLSDRASYSTQGPRVPCSGGLFSPREARAPFEGDVLSPRGSRIPLGQHIVSPRSARASSQGAIFSPRRARAPSERNGSMAGQPHTLTEERTDVHEDPSHGTRHRGATFQSGSGVQRPAVAGCVLDASQAPSAQTHSKMGNTTCASKRLVPPSKSRRYKSSKKDRKAADQPGAVPRRGPLFVGAHETSTLQPTLQRDTAPSKAMVRSLVPPLNLAPITAAAEREGAQLVGRRPDLQGAHALGGQIGGMPKSVAIHALQPGVRPGTMAPGLPKRTPNTASQHLSGLGRRPSEFGGAG